MNVNPDLRRLLGQAEIMPQHPAFDKPRGFQNECSAELFEGSVEEAREKAKQIISEPSSSGQVRCVEQWQQLSDGRIRFLITSLVVEGSRPTKSRKANK
jgi:hypothetical protein